MGGSLSEDRLRGLGAAASRAWRTARQGGLWGLLYGLLAATVYRRLVLVEYGLDRDPPRFDPSVPVSYGVLGRGDVEEYRRLRPDTPRAEVERRLDAGHVCFLARVQGRMVHGVWFAPRRAYIAYLDRELPLAPGDAYMYDSHTEPGHRGLGIWKGGLIYTARYLRAAGYRRYLATILPENRAAMSQMRHASGSAEVLGSLRLGPWRRDFGGQRLRPAHSAPRRPSAPPAGARG
jgi:hypothetical protein